MAFTYDLTTTGASLLISQVRLLVPDHTATAYELEDAEISFFLAQNGSNVWAAAADACDHLSRKFSQKVGFTADGLTVGYAERAREYAARAQELRGRVSAGMAAVTLARSDGFSEEAASGEFDTVLYTWRK